MADKDVKITDGVGRVIIANADQLTVEHLKSLLLADVGEMKPTEMAKGEGEDQPTPTEAATPEKQAQIDELLDLLSKLLKADLGKEMELLKKAIQEATKAVKALDKQKDEKVKEKKGKKGKAKEEEESTATPTEDKVPPTIMASTGMEQVVAALQNLGGLSEACCSRLIEAIKGLMPATAGEAATKPETPVAKPVGEVTQPALQDAAKAAAKEKATPVNEAAQTGVAEANKAAIQPQIDIASITPEVTGISEDNVDLGGKPGAVTRVVEGVFNKHQGKIPVISPTITIESIEPKFNKFTQGMVKVNEINKMIEDGLAASNVSITKLPVNVQNLDVKFTATTEKPAAPPVQLADITELPVVVDNIKVTFANKTVTPTAAPAVKLADITELPVTVDNVKVTFASTQPVTPSPNAVPPIKLPNITELPVTVDNVNVTFADKQLTPTALPKIQVPHIASLAVTIDSINVQFADKQLTPTALPKIQVPHIASLTATIDSIDVQFADKQLTPTALPKIQVPHITNLPVTIDSIDVQFAEKQAKDTKEVASRIKLEPIDELPITVRSLRLEGTPDVSAINKQIQDLLSKTAVPEVKMAKSQEPDGAMIDGGGPPSTLPAKAVAAPTQGFEIKATATIVDVVPPEKAVDIIARITSIVNAATLQPFDATAKIVDVITLPMGLVQPFEARARIVDIMPTDKEVDITGRITDTRKKRSLKGPEVDMAGRITSIINAAKLEQPIDATARIVDVIATPMGLTQPFEARASIVDIVPTDKEVSLVGNVTSIVIAATSPDINTTARITSIVNTAILAPIDATARVVDVIAPPMGLAQPFEARAKVVGIIAPPMGLTQPFEARAKIVEVMPTDKEVDITGRITDTRKKRNLKGPEVDLVGRITSIVNAATTPLEPIETTARIVDVIAPPMGLAQPFEARAKIVDVMPTDKVVDVTGRVTSIVNDAKLGPIETTAKITGATVDANKIQSELNKDLATLKASVSLEVEIQNLKKELSSIIAIPTPEEITKYGKPEAPSAFEKRGRRLEVTGQKLLKGEVTEMKKEEKDEGGASVVEQITKQLEQLNISAVISKVSLNASSVTIDQATQNEINKLFQMDTRELTIKSISIKALDPIETSDLEKQITAKLATLSVKAAEPVKVDGITATGAPMPAAEAPAEQTRPTVPATPTGEVPTITREVKVKFVPTDSDIGDLTAQLNDAIGKATIGDVDTKPVKGIHFIPNMTGSYIEKQWMTEVYNDAVRRAKTGATPEKHVKGIHFIPEENTGTVSAKTMSSRLKEAVKATELKTIPTKRFSLEFVPEKGVIKGDLQAKLDEALPATLAAAKSFDVTLDANVTLSENTRTQIQNALKGQFNLDDVELSLGDAPDTNMPGKMAASGTAGVSPVPVAVKEPDLSGLGVPGKATPAPGATAVTAPAAAPAVAEDCCQKLLDTITPWGESLSTIAEQLTELVTAAMSSGSIYTHDVTVAGKLDGVRAAIDGLPTAIAANMVSPTTTPAAGPDYSPALTLISQQLLLMEQTLQMMAQTLLMSGQIQGVIAQTVMNMSAATPAPAAPVDLTAINDLVAILSDHIKGTAKTAKGKAPKAGKTEPKGGCLPVCDWKLYKLIAKGKGLGGGGGGGGGDTTVEIEDAKDTSLRGKIKKALGFGKDKKEKDKKEKGESLASHFDSMSKTIAGVSMSEHLNIGAILGQVFEYNRGLRSALFVTQGIGGENKELQDSWSILNQKESIVAQTGQTITENMKVQQKLMGRGIKDLSSVMRIMKTSSNFATMMDVKAEDAADMFGTWSVQLGMSATQIQAMSRGMQSIARQTGLSGQNIMEAAKSSEGLLKAMRQSGNLTGDAAKNIVGMMASFKKAGVEEMGQAIMGAMSGPQGFLKAAPGIQAMLAQAAAAMGKSIADLPDILKDKGMMKQFGGNFKNQIRQIFGTLDFKNMSASQKFQANITAEAMGLGGIGDIERALGAMEEASMTFTDRLRDSGNKIAALETRRIQQGGVLTMAQRAELKALQDQQKALRSGRLQDFNSELRNLTDQGMSFGDAVSRMTANMSAQDRADMGALGIAGPQEALSAMVTDMRGQLNDNMRRTFSSMGMSKEFEDLKKKLDPEEIQRKLREAVTQEDKDKVFDDLENAQNTLAMAQRAATDPTYAFQMRLKILNEKLVKFISGVVDKLMVHGLKFVEWLEGMGPVAKFLSDNIMNVIIGLVGVTLAIGTLTAGLVALGGVVSLVWGVFYTLPKAIAGLFAAKTVASVAPAVASVAPAAAAGAGGARGVAGRVAGAAAGACPPAGPPVSCPGTDTKVGKFDFKGMVGGAGQMIKAAIGMGLVVLGVTALAVAILKLSSVILKYSGMDEKEMLKTGATIAALIVGTGLIAEAVNQTKNAFERLNVSAKMVGKMILGAAALLLIATGVVALATAILWISKKIIGLIGGPEEATQTAQAVLSVLWSAAQIGLAVAASSAVLAGLGALVATKFIVPLMILGAAALLILTPAIIGLAYAVIKLADAALNAIGTVDTTVAGEVAGLLLEAGKIGGMILLAAGALGGLGALIWFVPMAVPLMILGAAALLILTPAIIGLAYAVIKLADAAWNAIGPVDTTVAGKVAGLLLEAGKIGGLIALAAAALTGLGALLMVSGWVIPMMAAGAVALYLLTPRIIQLAGAVINMATAAQARIGDLSAASLEVPNKVAQLLMTAGKIGGMVALAAAALTGLGALLMVSGWIIPMMAAGAVALYLLTPRIIQLAGAVISLSEGALSKLGNLAGAAKVAEDVGELLKTAGKIALYIAAAAGGLAALSLLTILTPAMAVGANALKNMTPQMISLAIEIVNMSQQALASLGNIDVANEAASKLQALGNVLIVVSDVLLEVASKLGRLSGQGIVGILTSFATGNPIDNINNVAKQIPKLIEALVEMAIGVNGHIGSLGSMQAANAGLKALSGIMTIISGTLQGAGASLGRLAGGGIRGWIDQAWSGGSAVANINEVADQVPELVKALVLMAKGVNGHIGSLGNIQAANVGLTALSGIMTAISNTLLVAGASLGRLAGGGITGWVDWAISGGNPIGNINAVARQIPELIRGLVSMANGVNDNIGALQDMEAAEAGLITLSGIMITISDTLLVAGASLGRLAGGGLTGWVDWAVSGGSPIGNINAVAEQIPELIRALVSMANGVNDNISSLADMQTAEDGLKSLSAIMTTISDTLLGAGASLGRLNGGGLTGWVDWAISGGSPIGNINAVAGNISELVKALKAMAEKSNAELNGIENLNQTGSRMTALGNIVNQLTNVLAEVGPKMGDLTRRGLRFWHPSIAQQISDGETKLVEAVKAFAALGRSMIDSLSGTALTALQTTGGKLYELGNVVNNLANMLLTVGPKIVTLTGASGQWVGYTSLITTSSKQIPPALDELVSMIRLVGTAAARVEIGDLIATGDKLNVLANFIDTLSTSLSNIGAKINALTSGQGFLWQWPSMTDIITNGSPQITTALEALADMIVAVQAKLTNPAFATMGNMTTQLNELGRLVTALSNDLLIAGTSIETLTAGRGLSLLADTSIAGQIESGRVAIQNALAALIRLANDVKTKLDGLANLGGVSRQLQSLGTVVNSLSTTLTTAGGQIESLTTNRGWFQFRDNSFATRITNGSPKITEAITALAKMATDIKESLTGATEAVIDEVKTKLEKLSGLVDTLSTTLTNIATKLEALTVAPGWRIFGSRSLVENINSGSTSISPTIVALRQMVTAISAALTAGPSVGMMIATGDSLNVISNFVDTLSASLTNIGTKLNVLITGGLTQPWQTITNSIVLAAAVVPGAVTALLRMCRRIYWALIEDDTSLLPTTGEKLTQMSTFVDALSASLNNIGRKLGILINTTSGLPHTLAQNITSGGVIIAAAVAALAQMVRAIIPEVAGTVIGDLIATADNLNALSNFVDSLSASLQRIATKFNTLVGGSFWGAFGGVVTTIRTLSPAVPEAIRELRTMQRAIGLEVDGVDFAPTIAGLVALDEMVRNLASTLQSTSATLVALTGRNWWESFGSVTTAIRTSTPAVTGAVLALRTMANAVQTAVQGIDFTEITAKLVALGIMVDALNLTLSVTANRLVGIRQWSGLFSEAVANVRTTTPVIAAALQSLTEMGSTIGTALGGDIVTTFTETGTRLTALGDLVGTIGTAMENAAVSMLPLINGMGNFSATAENVVALRPQIVGAIRNISSLIRDGIVAEANQINDAEILQAVQVFDRVSDALLQLAVSLEQVGQRMSQVEAARIAIPDVGSLPAMPATTAMPAIAPTPAAALPGTSGPGAVTTAPLTAPPLTDMSVVLGQISADISNMLHHMTDVGSIQTHDTHIEKPIENIEKSMADVGDVVDKGGKSGKKGAKAIAPDSLDVDASHASDAKLVPSDAVMVKKLSLTAKEFNVDALGRQMQLSKLSQRVGSQVETGMSRQPLTANFDEVSVDGAVNDTLLRNTVETTVAQPIPNATANITNLAAAPTAVNFDQAQMTARAGEVAALTARIGTITAIPTILSIQAVDVPALNVPVTNLTLQPTNTSVNAAIAALTLPVNALTLQPANVALPPGGADQVIPLLTAIRDRLTAPIGTRAMANGGVVALNAGGSVNMGDAVAPIGAPVFQPVGTDTVPAMLTPGEFVVNASDAQRNMGLLNQINQGGEPPAMLAKGGTVYLSRGGPVGPLPTTQQAVGTALATTDQLRARQEQIANQLFQGPLPATIAANQVNPAQKTILSSVQTVPPAVRQGLGALANNANKVARERVIRPLLPTITPPATPTPAPTPALPAWTPVLERLRLDDTAWTANDRETKITEIVNKIRTELQNEAAKVMWNKTSVGGNMEEEFRIGVKHASDTLVPAETTAADRSRILTGLEGSDRGIYESIATLRDVEARRTRAESAIGGLKTSALAARGRGYVRDGSAEEVTRATGARVEYSNALRGMAIVRRGIFANTNDATNDTALAALRQDLTYVQRTARPDEDLSRYLDHRTEQGGRLAQRLGQPELIRLSTQAASVAIPERRRMVEATLGRAIGEITRYAPSVTETQQGVRATSRNLRDRVHSTDIQFNIAKAMREMEQPQHLAAINQLIAQSMSGGVTNVDQVRTSLSARLAPTRTDLQTAMAGLAGGTGNLLDVAQKADVHARVIKAIEKVNSPTFRPDQVPGGMGGAVYGPNLSRNIEQAIAALPPDVATNFNATGASGTPVPGTLPPGGVYTINGTGPLDNPTKLAADLISGISPLEGATVDIVQPIAERAITQEVVARRAAETALAAMRQPAAGANTTTLANTAQTKLVEAGAAGRAKIALRASEPYRRSEYGRRENASMRYMSADQRELLEQSERGDTITIQGEGGAGREVAQIPLALSQDAGLAAQLARATTSSETYKPGIGDVTSFNIPLAQPEQPAVRGRLVRRRQNTEHILYKKDNGAVLREERQGRNVTWSRWRGGNWDVSANLRTALLNPRDVVGGPGGMGGLPVVPGGGVVPPGVGAIPPVPGGAIPPVPAGLAPEVQARLDRLGPIYRTASRGNGDDITGPAITAAAEWPITGQPPYAYGTTSIISIMARGPLTIGQRNPRTGNVMTADDLGNERNVEIARTEAARQVITEGVTPYMRAQDTILTGPRTTSDIVTARWQEIQNNLRTGAAARPPAPATLSGGGVVGLQDGGPVVPPAPDRATLQARLDSLGDLGSLGTVYRTAGTDTGNQTQMAALMGQPNSFPIAEIPIGSGIPLVARTGPVVNNPRNQMMENSRITKAREALSQGRHGLAPDPAFPASPTAIIARWRTLQGEVTRQLSAMPPMPPIPGPALPPEPLIGAVTPPAPVMPDAIMPVAPVMPVAPTPTARPTGQRRPPPGRGRVARVETENLGEIPGMPMPARAMGQQRQPMRQMQGRRDRRVAGVGQSGGMNPMMAAMMPRQGAVITPGGGANMQSKMGADGPVGTPNLPPGAIGPQLARLDRMHGLYEQASRDLAISLPEQRRLITQARQQLGVTPATDPEQIRTIGLRVIENIENQLGIPNQRTIAPVRPVANANPPRQQVGDFPAPQPGGVQVAGGPNAPLGAQDPNIMTMPFMAEGGIIKKPTVIMAGEAGPEAIIPLNSPQAQPIMPKSDMSMEHAVVRERVTSQPETTQIDSPNLETVADESEKQTDLLKDLKKIMSAIEEQMKTKRSASVGNVEPASLRSMLGPNDEDTSESAEWGEVED